MKGKRARPFWNRGTVRGLRKHLGMTQQQLARELGTRQQTVSEWELGVYTPRGTSVKLLSMIAEQAGYRYETRHLADVGGVEEEAG